MPLGKKIRYIPANFRLYAPGEVIGSFESPGDWVSTTDHVGRLGTKRGEALLELNHAHGYLTWRFAWRISQTQYAPFRVAIGLYEKSYLEHLCSYPEKTQYLVDNAKDFYDNDESNTISGLNYFVQCDKLTHLQDIAIRRAMQILQLNTPSFRIELLIEVLKKIDQDLEQKFVYWLLQAINETFHDNPSLANCISAVHAAMFVRNSLLARNFATGLSQVRLSEESSDAESLREYQISIRN